LLGKENQMLRLTFLGLVSAFALFVLPSQLPAGEEESVSGLHSLPEAEFSALSSPDPNPLGAQALALHPEQWKHGETEHFIYHFVHSLCGDAGLGGGRVLFPGHH
jgi:hypothetical protein